MDGNDASVRKASLRRCLESDCLSCAVCTHTQRMPDQPRRILFQCVSPKEHTTIPLTDIQRHTRVHAHTNSLAFGIDGMYMGIAPSLVVVHALSMRISGSVTGRIKGGASEWSCVFAYSPSPDTQRCLCLRPSTYFSFLNDCAYLCVRTYMSYIDDRVHANIQNAI